MNPAPSLPWHSACPESVTHLLTYSPIPAGHEGIRGEHEELMRESPRVLSRPFRSFRVLSSPRTPLNHWNYVPHRHLAKVDVAGSSPVSRSEFRVVTGAFGGE